MIGWCFLYDWEGRGFLVVLDAFSLGFLLYDLILVCRRHGRWLWWSSQEAASESDAVCLVCGVGTRYGWYVVSNR